MTKCYFENLENIVISNLATNVRIAVAWINFNIYGTVINSLIDKGGRVKILLQDDFSNHRYDSIINQMNAKGAEIRFVDFRGIMHHKFCIIDQIRMILKKKLQLSLMLQYMKQRKKYMFYPNAK